MGLIVIGIVLLGTLLLFAVLRSRNTDEQEEREVNSIFAQNGVSGQINRYAYNDQTVTITGGKGRDRRNAEAALRNKGWEVE